MAALSTFFFQFALVNIRRRMIFSTHATKAARYSKGNNRSAPRNERAHEISFNYRHGALFRSVEPYGRRGPSARQKAIYFIPEPAAEKLFP